MDFEKCTLEEIRNSLKPGDSVTLTITIGPKKHKKPVPSGETKGKPEGRKWGDRKKKFLEVWESDLKNRMPASVLGLIWPGGWIIENCGGNYADIGYNEGVTILAGSPVLASPGNASGLFLCQSAIDKQSQESCNFADLPRLSLTRSNGLATFQTVKPRQPNRKRSRLDLFLPAFFCPNP